MINVYKISDTGSGYEKSTASLNIRQDLSNAAWRSHIQNKQEEVVLHTKSIKISLARTPPDKRWPGCKGLHWVMERLDKHLEESCWSLLNQIRCLHQVHNFKIYFPGAGSHITFFQCVKLNKTISLIWFLPPSLKKTQQNQTNKQKTTHQKNKAQLSQDFHIIDYEYLGEWCVKSFWPTIG